MHVAPSTLGIVLGAFHGISDCTVATSHKPDENVPNPVSRRYFGCVNYAQPAAGACPEIEHPAAFRHPFHDAVNQGSNLWDSACNSHWNGSVLGIHGL